MLVVIAVVDIAQALMRRLLLINPWFRGLSSMSLISERTLVWESAHLLMEGGACTLSRRWPRWDIGRAKWLVVHIAMPWVLLCLSRVNLRYWRSTLCLLRDVRRLSNWTSLRRRLPRFLHRPWSVTLHERTSSLIARGLSRVRRSLRR